MNIYRWRRVLSGCLVLGALGCLMARAENTDSLLIPEWTRSYALYRQPHALWLSEYEHVGDNLDLLEKVLRAAKHASQTPELVVYCIPRRDLGQSSEGGFESYEMYVEENRRLAKAMARFVDKTGIHPRVYLEPDALAMAVQYRRDHPGLAEAEQVYQDRIHAIPKLIALYHDAGAHVYLDGAHSGWFDYSDNDIHLIATVLVEAGVRNVEGITTNVSNRQPLGGAEPQNEAHYLQRLLPLLHHPSLETVVDSSRNGGKTKARQYYLAPQGALIDNELPKGRLVGTWEKGEDTLWLKPFFGKKKALSLLLAKEKYQWQPEKSLLTAPPWLDPVGDVQPGLPPTDHPPAEISAIIRHLRYIKPPDEGDGALNYPAGASKSEINQKTLQRQPGSLQPIPFD